MTVKAYAADAWFMPLMTQEMRSTLWLGLTRGSSQKVYESSFIRFFMVAELELPSRGTVTRLKHNANWSLS